MGPTASLTEVEKAIKSMKPGKAAGPDEIPAELIKLGAKGGGSKTQNGDFPCKIALRLKKVCYKVSLCENRQRQSCKAFIGLSIRGENFLYVKIWRILTHPLAKRRFLMYFRS